MSNRGGTGECVLQETTAAKVRMYEAERLYVRILLCFRHTPWVNPTDLLLLVGLSNCMNFLLPSLLRCLVRFVPCFAPLRAKQSLPFSKILGCPPRHLPF
jgi:hypothetical protein